MKDLGGKVAVITGGASGIGYSMAESFGTEGMKLVVADIEQGTLDIAVGKLKAAGFEVLGTKCDVAKYADVEALAKSTLGRFGKVHVVCNNAGVSITGPIFKMSLDDWRWVYDVNVWGVIHGIRAFVPILMEQGEEAHVVNTASLASFHGIGDHAPYCSTKAAVLSLSQALYSEMIAFNTKIGVSVVCPGMVNTAINKSWRNRPPGDQPWSDREYAQVDFLESSNRFQAAGVPPSDVARVTLEAIREGRFYVFNGMDWRGMLGRTSASLLNAENPPVITWGPDLRPETEQGGGA